MSCRFANTCFFAAGNAENTGKIGKNDPWKDCSGWAKSLAEFARLKIALASKLEQIAPHSQFRSGKLAKGGCPCESFYLEQSASACISFKPLRL